MTQAKIFVSYCHDDVDRDVLNMLVSVISEDPRVEVISDRLSRVGDDLSKFMDLIEQCHVVLVVCTPAYNRRIVNREKSVYTEYKAIIETYNKMNYDYETQSRSIIEDIDPLKSLVDQVRDRRFAVLPVLISGTAEESIPSEFRNKVAANFVGIMTVTWRSSGQARPQKNFRNAFDTFVTTAVETAVGIEALRRSEDDKSSTDVFDKIFFELKHDAQTFDRKTIKNLFVKTLEFKRVLKQQSYILVGRKGSGKSTLADFLTYGPTSKWKGPILYNVDDLPLEYLFQIVSDAPHQSDQIHLLTKSNAMKFAWEALIHYLCFEVLLVEFRNGSLSAPQSERFSSISGAFTELENEPAFSDGLEFLGTLSSVTMSRRHAFFGYALAKAIDFVRVLIAKAPSVPAEFERYIIKNLTPEHFFVSLFGGKFLATFYETIYHCQRKFMIALDGFDTNFQRFRQATLKMQRDANLFDSRTQFEQDWLSGLIGAVRRCKRRQGTAPLSSRVDFCVTIPKDRFIEYVEHDRDAFEWERKRIDISWTGIELSILLRKRLEVYKKITTPRSEPPIARLSQIMEQQFNWIPARISISLDKRTVELSLFQYLLRHSFWRPRDILFLSGRLISAAEHYRKNNMEFGMDTVKLIVSRSLYAIINLEFVGEFNGTVENIEDVIRKFRGSDQMLTFDEFFRKLDGVKLIRALSSRAGSRHENGASDHERILRLLYSVGFIGIYLTPRSKANVHFETPWIFIFNEGDVILTMQSDEDRKDMRIVIHPVFIEYLGLIPYRDTLVCEFSDAYLVKQEAHQVASFV